MTMLADTYAGKRVLVTGHTGFKGTWLSLWLQSLGAEVFGYSLAPSTQPSLFELSQAELQLTHELGDVRDASRLATYVADVRPDFVFHLAAQALVRESYLSPLETLATNVMGTANLLEAVRAANVPARVVIVTSDKCYENQEWSWGYRENEAMGGYDPYSMSKGCAELVTSSWRRSFFTSPKSNVRVASARAGNVIGGGDWSQDRIVVDCVNNLLTQQPIGLRNPSSTRPWQHVLEPLSGYLLLGSMLNSPDGERFADAWNFGPSVQSVRPVRELVEAVIERWGSGTWQDLSDPRAPHEAQLLSLNWEKAHHKLGWSPVWEFAVCIQTTVDWYKAWNTKGTPIRKLCLEQIQAYTEHAQAKQLAWARGPHTCVS